jgi:3-deoxy-D-manno-octulosonic-acid transferase
MPDTDRTARGYDIVRSLRRWLPFPKKRQPPALEPDAAEASVLRARPAEQGGAPLLWCHADSAEELEPLAGLLHRLREETDTLEFLLTSRGLLSKKVLGDQFPDGVTLGNCPSEDPAAIRRFLDRRRPDICLWVGSSHAPHLIVATVEDGIPVINVNASFPKNIWRRARVVRRSLRQLMEKFQAIYPLDTPSREGLLKFGLADGLVRDAGELTTLPAVLSHDEALRTQLGRAIGNRPVWLAFGVRPDELPTMLEAYRDAARLTHRLLLVLAPANLRDTDRFNARLAKGEWSIAVRSKGQEPVYDTQIVLEDTGDELGMWLRIAPVAFLGNSLTRGGGTDPMTAAALGSAILHGPFVTMHKAAYARLTAAGGAVEVSSAKSLAEAVCEVSIPDRAAKMAHAAWQIESDGAEVIRQVEQEILGCLQRKGKTL